MNFASLALNAIRKYNTLVDYFFDEETRALLVDFGACADMRVCSGVGV